MRHGAATQAAKEVFITVTVLIINGVVVIPAPLAKQPRTSGIYSLSKGRR